MVKRTIAQDVPAPDLHVIGVGFGRTGTLSLRDALGHLGYGPCDHMSENFAQPLRFAQWDHALERKRRGLPIDWRPLLSEFRAVVDWPGAYFWRELIRAHPDAKVILTMHEPESWYESCRRTIYRSHEVLAGNTVLRRLLNLLAAIVPPVRHGLHVVDDAIWEDTFHGRFHDRDHAVHIYEAHVAAVQAAVPPERLLVFDVREGWPPLCDFLGVATPPGEAFPHVNDAIAFQRNLRGRFATGLARSAAVVAFTTLAIMLARLGLLFWLKPERG